MCTLSVALFGGFPPSSASRVNMYESLTSLSNLSSRINSELFIEISLSMALRREILVPLRWLSRNSISTSFCGNSGEWSLMSSINISIFRIFINVFPFLTATLTILEHFLLYVQRDSASSV
uniref:Uncharacterized protein n=1 Tax=Octopus bimaculoides TaxID=37653 RepID=A0A0L8I0Y9_OCTBM